MKCNTDDQDDFPSVILVALARLDQKGADERITQAMAIVYEAFRMKKAKVSFSSDDKSNFDLVL